MRSKASLWFVAALTAAALSGWGCGDSAKSPGGATAGGAKASETALAHDFVLKDLEGRDVRLSDTAGKVRLIDFWATWCAPCREEIPMFRELHAEYAEHGLEIIAISDSDEGAPLIGPFVEEHQIEYQNLLGTEAVAEEYRVLGLPTAFLIDGEGRIVQDFFGPKPKKVLEKKIRELLELPPLT